MQRVLAHFVTDCARVTAYHDHVKICSKVGKSQIVLHGQIARNLFGNQEYFMPLVEVAEVTSIVGSSTSSEEDGAEGKTHLDLVAERVSDGLYRVGYSGSLDATIGVMIDDKTLQAIVTACRVSLLAGDQETFSYDEDFWVVHAKIGGDLISISPQIFEIIPEVGPKITIPRENIAEWLQIFAAADDLRPFAPHSMMRAGRISCLYKVSEDMIHLKITMGEKQVGITASSSFFAVCQRLMGIVWLGEDCLDEDFAFIEDEDDEDDDDL